MKTRTLAILGITFIGLALAAKFAGQPAKREAPGGLKPGARLFAIDDFNKVARISIGDNTQSVALVRGADKKWTVESLFNHPADFDRIADDILNKFDQLRVAEARKADGAMLKEYGLDLTATGEGAVTPIVVTLRDADGKELGALKIGKERSRPSAGGMGGFPDSQFVQLDKGPVVLVSETLGRPSATAKDWIATKLLSVSAESLERVAVTDKDGKSYEITRTPDGKYTAKEKAPAEEVKDDGARTLFGAAAYLNAANVAGKTDTTPDAFTGTNWTFNARATDGTTYTITLGKPHDQQRHARIAIGYEKPAMPAPTGTNTAEATAASFEEKVTKDRAAATALNAQLSPWTYLIDETAAQTFALPREQIIGLPNTNAPAATTSPAAMPPGFNPASIPGLNLPGAP